MSRLTDKNIVFNFGRTHGKTLLSKIMHKLSDLEDLEETIGCPLDILFKALQNDTIRYKDWYCVGISLYYNGAGKWCFATSYQDMYGVTRYIDEIDVATYGIDWWLIE